MSQLPFLDTFLLEVDLPEGLAFAHPEDGVGQHDEEALQAFLREFEDENEPLEVLGLFPADGNQ